MKVFILLFTCLLNLCCLDAFALNNPPIAYNDFYNIGCNTTLYFNPSINDVETDAGQILTFNVTSNPLHGSLTAAGGVNLAYTPDLCFSGTDTIYYEVCDNGNPIMCDSGIIIITIATCNCIDPPTAKNDFDSTNCNTKINFFPLMNDSVSQASQTIYLSSILNGPLHGIINVKIDNSIDYTPNNCYDGLDTILYTVCDKNIQSLCDTGIIIIFVRPCNCFAPVADFVANRTIICEGDCINFSDASTQGPTAWNWTFTGASTPSSTLANPTNICYPNAGVYNVSLVASNTFGSSAPIIKSGYIIVNSVPNSSVQTLSDTIGKSLILDASQSGVINYFWQPTTVPNDSLSSSLLVPVLSSYTEYNCTLVNKEGCRGNKKFIINAEKPLKDRNLIFVPNAISPNADGNNDVWNVKANQVKDFEAIIINRFGNIVFQSKNLYQAWNGTTNGVDQNSGVYFYYINVVFNDGEIKELKGDITVLY